MKQNEYLELVEQNKGKHRQPMEVLVQGRKNQLFDSVETETRIVAKFNVTSTSNPINILYNYSIDRIAEIEIDGVIQPEVVSTYTFDTTGEHVVKYTLKTSDIKYMFENCTALTNIYIPSSVTSIGTYAFRNCSNLTSITIPDSVTSIDVQAFSSCSCLKTVVFGNNVETIGNWAFEYCPIEGNLIIPDSVTDIGSNSFTNALITSLTIGSGISTIRGFYSCLNLREVTIKAVVPPTGFSDAFPSTTQGVIYYVPAESVEAYKAAWLDCAEYIYAIP